MSATGVRELPMFPLGSPLLPGSTIRLEVFEPRYRAMVADMLGADAPGDEPPALEFGVVMIERGHEVGGGDVRNDIGCRARIVDLRTTPDGRYSLVVVGGRRIRVTEWLPDDPYPRARVADWPDEHAPVGTVEANQPIGALVERVTALLTDMAAHDEFPADAVPPTAAALAARLADNVSLAVYQLAAYAPLGPLDRARLLAAPGLCDRVATFADVLDDAEAAVRFRRS
jgi:Lon protease-like protein